MNLGKPIKNIGVLTSGGDAPGMNSAIRSVVRTASEANCNVFGVKHGYAGLLAGDISPLGPRDVGGILQLGGTMLGSSRSTEFTTEAGQRAAVEQLERQGIQGLVVIGGNGSQTGAHSLSQLGFPVVGVASTIDNDLSGTDITIGVDTALNIALHAIDSLKTTASSFRRAFMVEVMGRDCGYLALMSGIAGGAESVIIPEVPVDPEDLAVVLNDAYQRGKLHALVVVAEGAQYNGAGLEAYFKEHEARLNFELRLTTLGHVQRGGAPTAFDRILASRFGFSAVRDLIAGKHGTLTGLRAGHMTATPLTEVVNTPKKLDPELFEVMRVLAV